MISTVYNNNKKITIIGTAHISKKNKQQVKEIIEKETPDVVAIELDPQRFHSIINPNRKETKFKEIFRTSKPGLFITYYFLSKYQRKIAEKYNISPGDEMLQAINSAKKINAKILLADRDAQLTIQKLLKTLNFWDKIKLFTSGFSIRKDVGKDFSVDTILEEVEKKEESKKINKIMDSLMNKNKKLKKILIDERNEFIAYNIQQAVKDPEVTSIVVVIGAGHVPGVIENLDNQHINIKKILSLK